MAMDYKDWCAQSGGNTGTPGCGPILGKPLNVFLGNKGAVIKKDELAVLQKTLIERANSKTVSNRIYPIGDFGQFDETSTEPTTANLVGYGKSEQLDPGAVIYSAQIETSICKAKMLQAWDGYDGVLWIADDNGNFIGKRLPNGDLPGLSVKVNVNFTGAFWKDMQNMKTVKLVLNLGDPKQLASNIAAVKYDFDISSITGIKDVSLFQADKNVFQVLIPCLDGNIYDEYHAEIAAAKWEATNKTDGSDIPATITENPAKKGFNVILTPPPAVGTPVELWVDLLSATGIEGFEAKPVSYIYES